MKNESGAMAYGRFGGMRRHIAAATAHYFSSRLEGTAPLATVFWRDMVLIGTGLVVLTLGLVVLLAANDAPMALIIAAYVVNWPYNIFVTVAVWRAAQGHAPLEREATRICAVLWLVFALVL